MQETDHTSLGEAPVNMNAVAFEQRSNDLTGARFFKSQLGIFVKVTLNGDEIGDIFGDFRNNGHRSEPNPDFLIQTKPVNPFSSGC
jgi:hypothetical protein